MQQPMSPTFCVLANYWLVDKSLVCNASGRSSADMLFPETEHCIIQIDVKNERDSLNMKRGNKKKLARPIAGGLMTGAGGEL